MRFLFLDRYDFHNPKSGGAERFTYNLIKELTKAGHKVTWFVSRGEDQSELEGYDGIEIMRKGSVLSVIYHAFNFYKSHKDSFDYVIDEIHSIPFFTPFYIDKSKRYSLIHEIAGQIWFYETPVLPVIFGVFGYLFEKFYLRTLYNKERFFTVSKSTQDELLSHGANQSNITILPEGIDLVDVVQPVAKSQTPQIFYSGGMRPLKRVTHQLRALYIIKKDYPQIRLVILGRKKGKYYNKLQRLIKRLNLESNVQFTGYVSDPAKVKLIKSSWLTISTSIKEGWGLAVAEAGAFGIPAVVYDVGGSRDAVVDGVSGVIIKRNTSEALADEVIKLLSDKELLEKYGVGAREINGGLSWGDTGNTFLITI